MLKIHTLEMKKEINSIEEESELRKNIKALDISYDNPKIKTKYTLFSYYGLCNKGVTVWIIKYKFSQNEIVLRINPQTVLGEDGNTRLFEINEEQLKKCFVVVKGLLKEYQIDLDIFRVSRIDFARDIQFEREESVDIMIRLLRKRGNPYRYHVTTYGDKVYKDSYDITHNDNILSVAVYNKEKQYKAIGKAGNEEIMKGVLRVEIRLQVERIIYKKGEVDFKEIELLERCVAKGTIEEVFRDGFYIKLARIRKILQKNCRKRNVGKRERNKLNKMLILAEVVAEKQDMEECTRGRSAFFRYETMQYILKAFEDMRINLVSISARENMQVMPDMRYLLGLKSKAELDLDYEFLIQNNLEDKVPKYILR